MFLWSLEVSFPHPVNTNSKEENKIISDEISIKIALERTNFVGGALESDLISDGGEDEDDCEVACPPGGSGNTTSGGDVFSVENRLLIASGTQIREEMFGIESRRTVQISIDEPAYYNIFRECHHNEWEQELQKT